MDKKNVKHFESLYKQLQPRLFAFCCKYVEDKELARDFVQECFISLWENYDSVQTSHNSYLFIAVRNRCISHFRSLKVHTEYEESVKLRIKEIEIHPEISDPLSEIYLKDISDLINRSINNLPAKCKRIFIMSRYEGMKNTEIASTLGISVRTVEAQVYNALRILKEQLQDYLPIILLIFYFFLFFSK